MAEIEESKITDITGGSELDKMDARAKAAVVVVSLGADRASQIYKYLSEQEIEDLTYEVAKLGKTNNAQVENALDEFYKMCLTHKMMTDGGLDYARSVLEKAFGETTARNLLEKVSKTLQSKPFNFFTKGDPKSLLALLQHERPQVIALIMSYMDPQQAAQILEQLPNEKRIPVLEGMANMSRVSPEAIAIVEEEMKRKFATIITSEDNMNLGGIDYVADVMNHVDRGNEKQIFDEMDKDNPELSKSIRDKMFMFENIIDMDPRSVQRFIRDCDSKDIVYALKTASEDMKNVFFANMSKRMAETVKGDLEITTNVRLKEVEEAQQRIVNLIRKLEDAGEVIINKGGDENVLRYKEQILDSIKAEHGTLLAQIRKKEAEIQELENKLVSAQNKMDDLKKQDVQIKDICLYGMYISEMEDQIRKKQEQLKLLQQQEEKKKVQVIAAKIDTSRYEKLKDRRQSEYEKAAKKAQELFIEEFASRTARYSQNREVI